MRRRYFLGTDIVFSISIFVSIHSRLLNGPESPAFTWVSKSSLLSTTFYVARCVSSGTMRFTASSAFARSASSLSLATGWPITANG